MREISFRAWDVDNKVMVIASTKRMLVIDTTNSLSNHAESNGYTLMQYTGLKDKNGTKIFEGDITKGNKGRMNSIVRFIDGCWCLDAGITPYLNDVIGERGGVEVIGNTRENKELLGDNQ